MKKDIEVIDVWNQLGFEKDKKNMVKIRDRDLKNERSSHVSDQLKVHVLNKYLGRVR